MSAGAIDFAGLGLDPVAEPRDLSGKQLVVSVNYFGFGGANAHVVLSSAPETRHRPGSDSADGLPQRRLPRGSSPRTPHVFVAAPGCEADVLFVFTSGIGRFDYLRLFGRVMRGEADTREIAEPSERFDTHYVDSPVWRATVEGPRDLLHDPDPAGPALRDLAAAERSYVAGLGPEAVWGATERASGEDDLPVIGPPGVAWRFDLTHDPERPVGPRP